MLELKPVKDIDVAVHFDFLNIRENYCPPSSEDQQRFDRCLTRVKIILKDPTAIMFYFSAYLRKDEIGMLAKSFEGCNQIAYDEEMTRIKTYQELLGERFFLYSGMYLDMVTGQDILADLKDKGYVIDSKSTSVFGYGEYLNACVSKWTSTVSHILEIDPKNCQTSPSLSLMGPLTPREFAELIYSQNPVEPKKRKLNENQKTIKYFIKDSVLRNPDLLFVEELAQRDTPRFTEE